MMSRRSELSLKLWAKYPVLNLVGERLKENLSIYNPSPSPSVVTYEVGKVEGNSKEKILEVDVCKRKD